MTFRFVLIVAVLGQMGTSFAQDITIRLLEPNGRPIAHKRVEVAFFTPGVGEFGGLEITTAADGTAKVLVPNPVPKSISVLPKDTGRLDPCSQTWSFSDLQQIIAIGVVSRCAKGTPGCRCKFSKRVGNLGNTAGELVLFFRPPTIWEQWGRRVWE